MGELSPFATVVADSWLGEAVRLEAGWDAANKVETGDGWALRGAADWRSGFLTLGAGYTRRATRAWTKDVWWARAGVSSGPLWILASIAPDSRNMEAKLEARIRVHHRWFVSEYCGFVEWHTTAVELGGYAYGVSIHAGWGLK